MKWLNKVFNCTAFIHDGAAILDLKVRVVAVSLALMSEIEIFKSKRRKRCIIGHFYMMCSEIICLMEQKFITSWPGHRASSQQTSHQSQAIKPYFGSYS